MATVAALRVARDLTEDAVVVVVLVDSGRGYMDKVFNDAWMTTSGFDVGRPDRSWLGGQAREVIDGGR